MFSDSDSDASSDIEFFENELDDFLYNHTDNMIDLFENIKERFYYFLGNRSEKLSSLIIDNCFSEDYKKVEIHDIFEMKYIIEISTTLDLTNQFLKNNKLSPISRKKWVHFCFENTIL